jgi:anti-anti-sigma factor
MTEIDLHPEVTVDHGITVIELGTGYESVDERALDSGLRTSLLQSAEAADPPVVLLDLSHTTFFGSSFIEILFRLWNRLNSRPGGNFAICGLTTYCLEVLRITHLDTLWRLYATRDEAIQDMSARPT